MADDDLARLLARLPAEQYARLRKFLLGRHGAEQRSKTAPEGDVTSQSTETPESTVPERKKPR